MAAATRRDERQARAVEVQSVLAELLDANGASRVTLRQDLPGDYEFPVTHEALAPGVGSLRGDRSVDLRTQPVVQEVRQGRQVVQENSRAAFDDPAFLRMLDAYGGLAAQIVTPVLAQGRLAGILSLHQLGSPRAWSPEEVALCAAAAERLGGLMTGSE